MITGIGTDIIEVERIRKNLETTRGFRERVFTEAEIAYCETKKNKAQHYAARFAAKEALLKAFGTGLRKGTNFQDIEVFHDEWGKPAIRLLGETQQTFDKHQPCQIHLSLTHIETHAVAYVVIEK